VNKPAIPARDASSDAELCLALRDTVARLAKPSSAVEIRRALPRAYQRSVKEISRLLEELARDTSVFAVRDGRTAKYSSRDVDATVEQAILDALTSSPLGKTTLAAQVKRVAPGFEKRLPAVLQKLVARGSVRMHPAAGAKHPARYGIEPPDPAPFLVKAVKEMQAAQKKLAPSGVTKEALYAALGQALGLVNANGKTNGNAAEDDASSILSAVHELGSREPPGALLSVRALRAMRSIPKTRFDTSVLSLSRAGKIILHHHDFPASLPETERAELVQDEHGTYYVGIALGNRG